MYLRVIFMRSNTAYFNIKQDGICDTSKPLIIESCGNFRIIKKGDRVTDRPYGRSDYQMLYISSGSAHFYFDKKDNVLSAGSMVIYRPYEMQKYRYSAIDHPDAYWVHFTGSDVEEILEKYHIVKGQNIYYIGNLHEYSWIFRQMIHELQLKALNFEEILNNYLNQIFLLISRQISKNLKSSNFIQDEIEYATNYFNEHYNDNIVIEDYAQSRGISACWFIKNFKLQTKTTPNQYILQIRLINAQSLLENTNYNVGEIAKMVGYDNQLYFSRIFKSHTGLSPLEFRRRALTHNRKSMEEI